MKLKILEMLQDFATGAVGSSAEKVFQDLKEIQGEIDVIIDEIELEER